MHSFFSWLRILFASLAVLASAIPAFGAGPTQPPNSGSTQGPKLIPAATTTFNVVNDFANAYKINGTDNPDLTLIRGQTYAFKVNASGHPFAIKSVQGPGDGDLFNEGVTNNGMDVGTVTFVVPQDAPNNLFYDCEIHEAMTGNLFITNPAPPNGSVLSATQTVAGSLTAGSTLTFTVIISNTGIHPQSDNPGNEFFESLPAQLTIVDANANSGTAATAPSTGTDGGSVTWNGSIAAGGSVTISFTATINPENAGQVVSAQGTVSFDEDGDGANEATALTDNPATSAPNDPNVFTLPSVVLSASQTVSGVFIPGGNVVYSVIITNHGTAPQPDNVGHEFTETLPAGLNLVSAAATAGTAVATTGSNTVTWDGGIAPSGSVTITIHATIDANSAAGETVSAQGVTAYDFELDGTNGTSGLTFAPPLSGTSQPTQFAINDPSTFAFVSGTEEATFDAPPNDIASGVSLSVTNVSQGQFGSVAVGSDGSIDYTPHGKLPVGGDAFTVTFSDGLGGSYMAAVTVRDFSDAAASYNGLITPPEGASPANAQFGLAHIVLSKKGAFTGSIVIGGAKFSLAGTLDTLGEARFGSAGLSFATLKRKAPAHSPALAPLSLSFQVAPGANINQVTGAVTQNGAGFAKFAADRAFYTAKANPPPPLLAVPTDVLGPYTILFPATMAPNQGLSADDYPQGSGYALLSVAKNGVASLEGKLADGTALSYQNALSSTNTWPFYLSLYQGQGSLSGLVEFRDDPVNQTDVDGLGMNWYRPLEAHVKTYTNGWPNGILLDFIGSKFALPAAGSNTPILPGLDNLGDANITLGDGNLSSEIVLPAGITAKNKVFFASPPAGLRPKLTFSKSGLISGSFVHPGNRKVTNFQGVVFQKQSQAQGYFIGPSESGEVLVAPQ